MPESSAVVVRKPTAATTTSTTSRRRKSGQPKSLPPFVKKLWSTVNDQENSEYIHWTQDGESFRVVNREMFEKTVLPKYYKHTNFSSFVRQLNMYGFHKVQDVQHSNDDCWKFESPNFKRDREDLLPSIVRNKANDEEEDDDMSKVLNELQTVKTALNDVAKDVMSVRKDNEVLWNQNSEQKIKYQQQYATINKIVRFLSAIYGNQRFQDLASPKTPQRLLTNNDTNTINENFASTTTTTTPPNNKHDNLITPGLLENVRISDLELLDESSPTNSDKSEENEEYAQRILANTLRTNELDQNIQNQSKALSVIEDLIRSNSSPTNDFNADDFINMDDYVSLEDPDMVHTNPKKRRLD